MKEVLLTFEASTMVIFKLILGSIKITTNQHLIEWTDTLLLFFTLDTFRAVLFGKDFYLDESLLKVCGIPEFYVPPSDIIKTRRILESSSADYTIWEGTQHAKLYESVIHLQSSIPNLLSGVGDMMKSDLDLIKTFRRGIRFHREFVATTLADELHLRDINLAFLKIIETLPMRIHPIFDTLENFAFAGDLFDEAAYGIYSTFIVTWTKILVGLTSLHVPLLHCDYTFRLRSNGRCMFSSADILFCVISSLCFAIQLCDQPLLPADSVLGIYHFLPGDTLPTIDSRCTDAPSPLFACMNFVVDQCYTISCAALVAQVCDPSDAEKKRRLVRRFIRDTLIPFSSKCASVWPVGEFADKYEALLNMTRKELTDIVIFPVFSL